MSNLNVLIRPTLEKIAARKQSKRDQVLVEILQNNINDITSSMNRRLIIETRRLTPAEIQIANLIRQGKTTKEISGILGVEVSTIDFHRLNIRRKLNLTNKSLNLRTYLNSLS